MLGLQYVKMWLDHTREHRPRAYREYQEAGTLNYWAQKYSRLAASQVANLMLKGLPLSQAEELVLPEVIYPKPGRDDVEEEEPEAASAASAPGRSPKR